MTSTSTRSTTSTTSSTAVGARSITYTVRKVMEAQFAFIEASGMSGEKYARGAASTELALTTWMLSGHAVETYVEAFTPGSNRAAQRFDIDLQYADAHGPEDYQNRIDAVREETRRNPLQGAHDYRVVVTTSEGAPEVPGWSSCTPRSTDGLSPVELGPLISSPRITARGRIWK